MRSHRNINVDVHIAQITSGQNVYIQLQDHHLGISCFDHRLERSSPRYFFVRRKQPHLRLPTGRWEQIPDETPEYDCSCCSCSLLKRTIFHHSSVFRIHDNCIQLYTTVSIQQRSSRGNIGEFWRRPSLFDV